MALHPQDVPPVPDETRRLARAAFPRGNVCMRRRDALGTTSHAHRCAHLFFARGQPAGAPWRRALTTVMPCAEGLSDRRAADAVRRRIDWQDAPGLEWTAPGFDHTVLSECRTRLVTGPAEQPRPETWPTQVRERGLLKVRGRQPTEGSVLDEAGRRGGGRQRPPDRHL
jgi:transposase